MPDPEHQRLGEASERIIALRAGGDTAGALVIWDDLTIREQRMVVSGLAAMVAHLRAEKGDPPDSLDGPAA
jgi:hypothetical protein